MDNLWIWQLLGIVLLLAPIVLAILFWQSRRAARKEVPREDGEVIEFFVTSSMRLLVTYVLAALIVFTIVVAVSARKEDGNIYAVLIPLTVFVLILLVRPVPVVVDRNGIRQSRWFLPDKEIAWKDVDSVAFGPNTGATYVRSKKSRAKIRFSAFLVGRKRFKREIRANTSDVFENSEED